MISLLFIYFLVTVNNVFNMVHIIHKAQIVFMPAENPEN